MAEAAFKATGNSSEFLENKQSILTQQLEQSRIKTEALAQKLETAKRIYGEGASEVDYYQKQLNYALAAEQRIQGQINATTAEIKQQADAAQDTRSAYERLSDTVYQQKTELEGLKREYASVVLEQGESSQEAQELAAKITSLNNDLNQNEQRLQAAKIAAEQLGSGLGEAGTEAEDTRTTYERLSDTIDQQKTELEELKREYANVVLEQGESSQEAQQLAGKIQNLSNEVKESTDKMRAAEQEADKLDATLQDVGDSANKAGDGFTVVKGIVSDLASNAIQAAVQGLKDMGSAILDNGIEFTSTMSEVQALSGATATEFESLEAAAKNMGETTTFTSTQAAEALKYMSLAGWKAEEQIDGLPNVLQLAQAAAMDLGEASDIVTDYLTAFGMEARDTSTFVDVLAQTSTHSNTDVTQMGEAFKNVAALCGTLGFSVQDASLAIGVMANAGIKGSSAGTTLKTALANLANPTDKMRAKMDELGISLENSDGSTKSLKGVMDDLRSSIGGVSVDLIDSEGNLRSYDDIMSDLTASTDNLSQVQQIQAAATIFGKESMAGMLSIISASEDDYNYLADAIDNSAGAAEKMSETMTDNLAGDLALMESGFAGVGQTIFEQLEQPLRNATQFITGNVVPALNVMANNLPTVAVAITGIGAAIVATVMSVKGLSIMSMISGLGSAVTGFFGMLVENPIGLIILGITALVAVGITLYNHWDEIKAKAAELWSVLQEKVAGVVDIITTKWNEFVGFWQGIWDTVTQVASSVWDTISNVVQVGIMLVGSVIEAAVTIITLPFQFIWQNCQDIITDVWKNIASVVSSGVNAVKSVVTTVFNAVKSVITTVWNGIKSVITSVLNNIKSVVSTGFNAVKTTTSTIFNAVKSVVSTVWNGITSTISSVVNGIKSTVSSAFNSVKTSITTPLNAAKSSVTSIFEGIKSTITNTINSAKSVVQSGLNAIKGFFSSCKLSLPQIKLPHFKITGSFSLNPPSVPHLTVSWYKEGGILTAPAIFGAMGGRLLGGGEAGPEAVLPIEKLRNYIGEELDRRANNVNMSALVDAIERLANRDINFNIDGERFAIATAGPSDAVNGNRMMLRNRGVAL